jgi:hypothetical protein
MAATSINIQVDIPRGYQLSLEELKRQLALYAQFVINQAKPVRKEKTASSLLSLRGILKTNKTDAELLDEYFKEKYGL